MEQGRVLEGENSTEKTTKTGSDSDVKQEKMDVNEEQTISNNQDEENKKMDVDEHDKSTTEPTTDTQILSDETSSTLPKTTNTEQDGKKLSTNDINERDIKTAAASALSAAAVKAKVI